MTGYCENCAKQNECHKDIGIIWGFCNSDYAPKPISDDAQEIHTVFCDNGRFDFENKTDAESFCNNNKIDRSAIVQTL